MIDIKAILELIKDLDREKVLTEIEKQLNEGYREIFGTVNIATLEVRLKNSSSIQKDDYILMALNGDKEKTFQMAYQFLNISAYFCLWKMQLSQLNYFSENPQELPDFDYATLAACIQSHQFAGDAAGLGHYASEKEQPVYQVIDINSGEFRYAAYSEINPCEYPIFCLLPDKDKRKTMEMAMHAVQVMDLIKLTAVLNIKRLIPLQKLKTALSSRNETLYKHGR